MKHLDKVDSKRFLVFPCMTSTPWAFENHSSPQTHGHTSPIWAYIKPTTINLHLHYHHHQSKPLSPPPPSISTSTTNLQPLIWAQIKLTTIDLHLHLHLLLLHLSGPFSLSNPNQTQIKPISMVNNEIREREREIYINI